MTPRSPRPPRRPSRRPAAARRVALFVPCFVDQLRSRLGEPAALLLAERVAVVLARTAVVADLRAAYGRLDMAAESFGALVAGPPRTADFEQALAVGAHGPTALAVFLVDEGEDA